MEMKYYATSPLFLTTTEHKGRLEYSDVVRNLMRMILMSEEETDAETALKELDQMPKERYDQLRETAEAWMQDSDLQDYLERNHLKTGQNGSQLYPIAELLNDPDEEPMTEEALKASLMESLDEFPMEAFKTWELPYSEWD